MHLFGKDAEFLIINVFNKNTPNMLISLNGFKYGNRPDNMAFLETLVKMNENLDELGVNNYHVLRFDHDDNYNPYFILWDCENKQQLLFPILNKHFNVEISNDKYCISTIFVNTLPYNYCGKKLNKNHIECKKCFELDYFNQCSICNGSECLLKEKKCLVPYLVYLALFGNIIKVGVSKSSRYPKRTFEQGADYSTIIANAEDGLLARKIERQIINQFKIRDKLKINEKIKLLRTKVENNSLIETANRIVKGISGFNEYLVTKIEILNLNSFRILKELNNIPLENKGNIINGRIIGSKGHLLFIEDKNTISVLNLNRIIGKKIKKSTIKIPTQVTLFSG